MQRLIRHACFALITLGGLRSAGAEEHAATRLTEAEAIAIGAERGPSVDVARAPQSSYEDALDASRAFFIHSPRLSGFVGERAHGGGAGFEANVSVLQDIALRSIGGPREDAAHALLGATKADLERARLEAAARAADAWIRVRESEEVLALRRAVTVQANALARLAHVRVDAGTSLPADAAIADGDLALGKAAELDAEGFVTEALAELRFAIGEPPSADVDAVGALELPAAPPFDGARHLELDRAPTVALASARAALSKSDARLARALAEPTVAVGASFTHEGTGDDIWTAIVQVPLPFSQTGRYDAARQLGQAAADERQVSLVRAELAQRVALAIHECEHTRETHAAYASALRPLAEAVRMAGAQLEAGTATATVVSVARQRLLEAEERVVHAIASALRADVELARITSTLVPTRPGARAP